MLSGFVVLSGAVFPIALAEAVVFCAVGGFFFFASSAETGGSQVQLAVVFIVGQMGDLHHASVQILAIPEKPAAVLCFFAGEVMQFHLGQNHGAVFHGVGDEGGLALAHKLYIGGSTR